MAVSLVSTGVQFPDSTIQTTAAGASAFTLVATKTANGSSSSLSWTGLSGSNQYFFVLNNLLFSASDTLVVTFGTGSGPTYISSGYSYLASGNNTVPAFQVVGTISYRADILMNNVTYSWGTLIPVSWSGTITGLTAGTPHITWQGVGCNSAQGASYIEYTTGGGYNSNDSASTPITAIKFEKFSGGTISSGTASLYKLTA